MSRLTKCALKFLLNRGSEYEHTTLHHGSQARWYLNSTRENRAEMQEDMKQDNRWHAIPITEVANHKQSLAIVSIW
jgi:hypothetical protein